MGPRRIITQNLGMIPAEQGHRSDVPAHPGRADTRLRHCDREVRRAGPGLRADQVHTSPRGGLRSALRAGVRGQGPHAGHRHVGPTVVAPVIGRLPRTGGLGPGASRFASRSAPSDGELVLWCGDRGPSVAVSRGLASATGDVVWAALLFRHALSVGDVSAVSAQRPLQCRGLLEERCPRLAPAGDQCSP